MFRPSRRRRPYQLAEAAGVRFGTLYSPLGASAAFPKSNRLITLAFVLGFALFLPDAFAQRLQFGSDAITDSIEAIKAKSSRSEAEEDRLIAAAHFSYGRMLLQHGEMAGGLRQMQRAYRWDPAAGTIVRDIVPLASTLGRHAEAVRYAILSAEQDPIDFKILQPLAEILAEQGQHDRAIRLLEKAVEVAGQEKQTEILVRAELGRLYLLTEKFEKSAETFAPVRELLENPDKVELPAEVRKNLLGQKARWYALIGETYVRTKRFDEASAMFSKGNEATPNASALAVQQAYVAVERGDAAAARKQLEQYFAAKSAAAGALPYELLERVVGLENQDAAEAKKQVVTWLEQLRQTDPLNDSLGYALAAKYLELERFDEADSLFKALVEHKPTPGGFRSLGEIYRRRGDAAAFVQLLGLAVEKGEATREFLELQASEIAKRPEWFDSIVRAARDAAPAAAPQQASRDVGLALLAIAARKTEPATEFHERAVATKGMAEHKIHEVIGMSLLLADQSAAAAKVWARALESSPPKESLGAYYFYLATSRAIAGDYDAALEAARKCAELDPNSPQFQARPAWVMYHAKRFEDARQAYRELIKKFDEKHDSAEVRDQLRQARMILSNIAVLEKKLPEAEEWLELVLDEFPEDFGAQNDLGYLWADAGKHLHRALAMCQAAVRSEPENGAYRDSLGWAHYRLGEFDKAIEELEKAASLNPDGVIYDHLGDAYLKANQVDKARDAWKKALAHFEQEKDVEKQPLVKSKLEQLGNP